MFDQRYCDLYFPELDGISGVRDHVKHYGTPLVDVGSRVGGAVREGAECLARSSFDGWSGAVLRPIEHVVQNIRTLVDSMKGVVSADTTFYSIIRCLEQFCTKLCIRSLVTHLDTVRQSGELTGETSSERFHDYVERMAHGRLGEQFWLSNSVLYGLVASQGANLLEAVSELCIRFEADRDRLVASGLIDSRSTVISSLQLGAGDFHNSGRSVCVVHLSSSGKVVYKPKSLSSASGFSALVSVFRDRLSTKLRVAETVDCGDYGWQEFVDSSSRPGMTHFDTSVAEYGCLGALFYMLGSSDMHLDNIVIDEYGHVVVIDHETLLTPEFVFDDRESTSGWSDASKLYRSTIFGVGIFPSIVAVDGTREVVDLGGICRLDSSYHVPPGFRIVDFGFDTMRLGLESRDTDTPARSSDENWSDRQFRILTEHFERTYRALLASRVEFISTAENCFSGASFRAVFRPTSSYSKLSWAALHPLALESWEKHVGVMTRLAFGTSGPMINLLPSEIDSLVNGDVPFFPVYGDARGCDGAMSRVIASSPVERMRVRCCHASEADLFTQLDVIRILFVNRTAARKTLEQIGVGGSPDRNDLLGRAVDSAEKIASYLKETSIRDSSGRLVGWFNPRIKMDSSFLKFPSIQDCSLGSGLAGNSLFLAGCVFCGVDCSVESLAIEAASEALRRSANIDSIGMHAGLSGVCYGVFWVGRLLGRPRLCESAVDSIVRAWTQFDINSDVPLDYAYGLSGFVSVVLSLVRYCDLPELQNVLIESARLLIDAYFKSCAEKKFIGFAHGQLGILFCLKQICSATTHVDFETRERARAGVSEINSVLSSIRSTSGRLPAFGNGKFFVSSWCHGLMGQVLAEGISLDEAFVISTVRAGGFQESLDLSLCHGYAGVSEIMGEVYLDSRRVDVLDSLIYQLSTVINECDISSEFEYQCISKSLLDGIVGVSYSALKSTMLGELPPVLWAGAIPDHRKSVCGSGWIT